MIETVFENAALTGGSGLRIYFNYCSQIRLSKTKFTKSVSSATLC